MPHSQSARALQLVVLSLVALAGGAALSWQLLWSHYATLALGASAHGAAITLAATMGGMTLGALGMGRWLRTRSLQRPARVYALLEVIIGVSGLGLPALFALLTQIDSAVYRSTPMLAPLVHLAMIALALLPATAAMGATVPVFGFMARGIGVPLSRLYALNTLGAAAGVLFLAFWALSLFGVELTGAFVALLNFVVAGLAARIPLEISADAQPPDDVDSTAAQHDYSGIRSDAVRYAVVFATGFVTFVLEVAWFRAIRSALHATTDSFALMLTAVLLPLAISARLVGPLRRRGVPFGAPLVVAAALILLGTPAVERFDLFVPQVGSWSGYILARFACTLLLIGPAILALGLALPWLLDEAGGPARWSRLYALNTAGAVVGSLAAAWWILPAVGFAKAAWFVGVLTGIVGLALVPAIRRPLAAGAVTLALLVAVAASSGVGTRRIIDPSAEPGQVVVESRETPDATVSVIDSPRWGRVLVIDGFYATAETASAHYMEWMGRVPMLLHDNPRDALVICFGTGQTANAVRNEGVERLDVVELSSAVLRMAHYFELNEGVLDDPRVTTQVMDGRAWLRRTDRRYDVITLEPMPPNHAGVNSLYSREFYDLAAARLNPGGIVAQWLPFHLVTTHHSIAITRAFVDVFPDAMLWVDPVDRTGILVGRQGTPGALATSWPGLARDLGGRDLTPEQVRDAAWIAGDDLLAYAAMSEPVTDDNQLLAYLSPEERRQRAAYDRHAANLDILQRVIRSRPARD